MKQIKFLFVAAIAAALAACGGGGAPTVTPTVQPSSQPQAFSAKIVWSGANLPHGVSTSQSLNRRKSAASYRVASTSASPTPYPVILTEPQCTTAQTTDCVQAAINDAPNGNGSADMLMQVNPSPSPMPSQQPTWTTTDTTDTTVSVDQAPLAARLEDVVPGATCNTTVTANLGGLNVQTNTTALCFHRITLACWPADETGKVPSDILPQYQEGVTLSNGQAVPATSPASADLYFSGQGCYGAFQGPEAVPTLHAPSGATWLSSVDVAYLDLTLSQYTGAQTSMDIATMRDDAHNGAHPLDTLIVNTPTGDKYAIFFSVTNEGQGTPITGTQFTGNVVRHGDGPWNF